MMPVLDPLLTCGTCGGRGWLEDSRGLSYACWCRTKPMEVS